MSQDSRFYVICNNDSIEYVVVDRGGEDDDAQAVAERMIPTLANNDFERNPWIYAGATMEERRANYNMRCYWHIHTSDGVIL